jgi:hypothetical protein
VPRQQDEDRADRAENRSDLSEVSMRHGDRSLGFAPPAVSAERDRPFSLRRSTGEGGAASGALA